MLIALAVLIVGQLILVWQYNRLEKERLQKLEEEFAAQKQEFQEQMAEDVLTAFLDARIAREEQKALRYVTEQAMQQHAEGAFVLLGEFTDYEIQRKEKLDETTFRFYILLTGENKLPPQVEILRVTKILGEYYIDSVELGG